MTSKSYRARIELSAKSRRVATSIRDALAPDLKRLPKTEGRAEISLKNSDVIFTIETNDIASLRASVNSYLRLADASYRCITAIQLAGQR
ncbi:MAG TPA: KEOPS complex subunit Pcc1 [Nitrososphaera sp.]|nr:KEOPS complex subunit Pcc1 [Nitrososphaera sp.]